MLKTAQDIYITRSTIIFPVVMLFSLYLQHTAEARTQLEDATYCNIKADKHPLEMENKLSSVRKSDTK